MSRIPIRDLKFDVSGSDMSSWHAAGRSVSHFFNAMSLFFPKGEKFFISAVRQHREFVHSNELVAQVKGFVGQEAMHSREHRKYIECLEKAGYDVADMDVRLFDEPLSDVSLGRRLATTIALEHFTASLSHQVLLHPELATGDPQLCLLWKWHAVEEVEHKCVAYDVFTAAYGSSPKSYLLRTTAALQATYHFMTRLYRNYRSLAAQDPQFAQGSPGWQLFKFLWLSPGLFLRMTPDFIAYFVPGFHPSRKADDHLVSPQILQALSKDMETTRGATP